VSNLSGTTAHPRAHCHTRASDVDRDLTTVPITRADGERLVRASGGGFIGLLAGPAGSPRMTRQPTIDFLKIERLRVERATDPRARHVVLRMPRIGQARSEKLEMADGVMYIRRPGTRYSRSMR